PGPRRLGGRPHEAARPRQWRVHPLAAEAGGETRTDILSDPLGALLAAPVAACRYAGHHGDRGSMVLDLRQGGTAMIPFVDHATPEAASCGERHDPGPQASSTAVAPLAVAVAP